MKKNNIWILHHYAIPNQIGVGERPYRFAKYLTKKGYKVKVFAASTIHNSGENLITDSRKYLYKEFDNVPFIFIKTCNYKGNGTRRVKNMLDYAIGLMSVSKRFDSEKPDIIIASSVHPLTWIAGYKLSRRYNAKFIAETRDLWPETLVAMGKIKRKSITARILYSLEKFIYKKADKLIFTFPGGKDYVENIGLNSSKVVYINNGVDLEEFNKNKIKYNYKDTDLDDNNIFKIIYTGSLGKANALYRVIEVAKIIMEKNINDVKFYIFGDGPDKEKLENYVVKNGIKNVIFKGKVEKIYIPNILSKGNINLFSLEYLPNLFKYGLSPNKMFDYFASGKPTLSNIECGYDILKKYNCGITVKGGSVEALVEGILKFYNMPQKEYGTYCKNALRAARDFDYKILSDRLEKVILELLDQKEETNTNTIN